MNRFENSLTVYSYPSRTVLDWSSPQSVLKSFVGITIGKALTENKLVSFVSERGEEGHLSSEYKSTMGHAISHVQCTNLQNEKIDRWVSFSGQDFAEVDKKNLLEDQIGMRVFFITMPMVTLLKAKKI